MVILTPFFAIARFVKITAFYFDADMPTPAPAQGGRFTCVFVKIRACQTRRLIVVFYCFS